MIGQKWGLKPKMVLWLYTAVVRPMITYAALVGWLKVDQVTTCKELTKIQRLACLAVTGAMRSSPTTALATMLNLSPLNVVIKKEAALAAYRLLEQNKYKPGDLTGHLKILEIFSEMMDLHKVSDNMQRKICIDRSFNMVIPKRQEWQIGSINLEDEAFVYYTDGSKKDGSVGIGIAGPGLRHYSPMGHTPTVFQAEIHAIEVCARKCLDRGTVGKKVYILSDSQAALKALTSWKFESKLVFECRNILEHLAQNRDLTLMWVPGHMGIPGNERADELAKRGSETKFIGPEPFCGLGFGNILEKLLNWELQMKAEYRET